MPDAADRKKFDGYSWLEIPGTTPYTKGSEVENAETSAWGRAIGSLGILIDASIASQNEIDAKAGADAARTAQEARNPDGGLIGTAEAAKPPHDANLRQGPEGSAFGFGLKEGRQIVRVIAFGPLADALAMAWADDVSGKRVECYGKVEPDEWVIGKGTDKEKRIGYLRLTLERIVTPTVTLPALDAEIESLPMFGEGAA